MFMESQNTNENQKSNETTHDISEIKLEGS